MSSSTEQNREAFAADPDNRVAFEALEEQYFMNGEWDSLASLYRQRLTAPSLQSPTVRVPMLLRLGQVLEERCCDLDGAIEAYTEIARTVPDHGPALRQLRRIYVRRERWELVLQIAELEARTPLAPHEAAELHAELGEIWRRELLDLGEAMNSLHRALASDPDHIGALRSLARTHQALGEAAEAAACWEKLRHRLCGEELAPVLVALGQLSAGPLKNPERSEQCYREALEADRHCIEAVDALVIITYAQERWQELEDLYERRFDLTSGARRRSAIALEAARLHVERLDDAAGAAAWIARALDLCPEDVAAQHAKADVARRSGDTEALREAVEQVIALSGDAAPASALLEMAELLSADGHEQSAAEYLERALERAPEDSLVLEALSDSLSRGGRHHRHAEVLEMRAELAVDDEATRAEVLAELGGVYTDDLDDAEAGVEAYERALAITPDAPGVALRLERLYWKREDWTALRSLLESRCESGSRQQQVDTWCALGELLRGPLGDTAGASGCFEHALALRDDAPRALRGLNEIAHERGDEQEILRLCEHEARVTDDVERLAVLVDEIVARLEPAGRLDDALGWLSRLADADPTRHEPLERIAAHLERLGRSSELIETLERLDPLLPLPMRAGNRRRRAELYEAGGRHEDAVACWRAVLEDRPDDLASLRALESHLEGERDWSELADVRRALSRCAPESERPACLDALARLLEGELGDPSGAIDVLAELAECPSPPADLPARRTALLERTGRYPELVALLAERRESAEPDERWRLDLERARLLMDRLDDFEASGLACREVLAVRPDCQEAATRLERAVRLSGDSAALAALLEELASREPDPALRAERSLERATLLEDALDRSEEAISLYAALIEAPHDAPDVAERAERRLEQILERTQDFPRLAALREKQLAASPDDAARLALREELAHLYLERLEDPARGREHLEAAAEGDRGRVDLWRRLAELAADEGRPADALVALEAQLECGPDPARELELRIACGRLRTSLPGRTDDAVGHFERALELEPDNAEALEFLIDHSEAEHRPRETVRLLGIQLDSLRRGRDADRRLALRLRIAELEHEALDDVDAAVATLEPGLDEPGGLDALLETLADLYEEGAYDDALAALCRRALEATAEALERARWSARLGSALRALGDLEDAARAYETALEINPQDAPLRATLCDLYRDLDAAAPLAELLEIEVSAGRGDAIAQRLELATLYEERLDRADDALDRLEEALQRAPERDDIASHAMSLAEALDREETLGTLIEDRLARGGAAHERASLLVRRARRRAGPLGRPDEAIDDLREALSLAPDAETRRELRSLLERSGRYAEALDCLHEETVQANDPDRARLYAEAADLAERRISREASRIWLERLRTLRPDDREILRRLAEAHREAGRTGALLGCLEDELALLGPADASRAAELHRERAGRLERDLAAPASAARALEEARQHAPGDSFILSELDRLYARLGRPHERIEVLEARLASPAAESGPERAALHRGAAALLADELGDRTSAVAHLLRAIALTGQGDVTDPRCAEPLAELMTQIEAGGGGDDAWTRAALAWLGADRSAAPSRRADVRLALAARQRELGRGDAALLQCETLLTELGADELPDARESAEALQIDLLRESRRHIELAEALSRRTQRTGDVADWTELARLEEETLHRPLAALRAYDALRPRATGSGAIRGFRRCAERLERWNDVAEALQQEIDGLADAPERQRESGALLRTLGAVHRDRRGCDRDAEDAFRRALDGDPEDLAAVRALASLLEASDRADEAVDLLEREVELLDDDDAPRRHTIWLKAAHLAQEKLHDTVRAEAAYAEAAGLAPLTAGHLHTWASLHDELGDLRRYAEILAQYCEAPDSDARARDHLTLALSLEEQGDREGARERLDRAIELDAEDADAWEAAARLAQDAAGTADALERAAALRGPSAACDLLIEAADGLEGDARSAALLRAATERDPASARAHALLALAEHELGQSGEAQAAADRAIQLDADAGGLPAKLALASAHVGGRNAAADEDPEAAARFYGRALEIEPEDRESLEGRGEALFRLGELTAARPLLESRLALDPPCPGRARMLAMIGCALEAEHEPQQALRHFDDAIAEDGGLALAHAGRCRVREAEGQLGGAIEALVAFAEAADDDSSRAASWLRAADIELGRDDRDAARPHLQAAIEADPQRARAATLLAELEWDADEPDAAHRACLAGLEIDELDSDARARLETVRARVLALRGERAEAEAAWGAVIAVRPESSEAVEARASLLRSLGDWEASDDVLAAYIDRRRGQADPEALARLLLERGRLLAGPLERVELAIGCLEEAVSLDEQLVEAREQLAGLQSHLPEHFPQAVRHHEVLLTEDPTRRASLRALQRIADTSPSSGAARRTGLGILRALGLATVEEREEATDPLDRVLPRSPRMNDDLAEALRVAVQHSADALESVLPEPETTGARADGFGRAVEEAEADLSSRVLRGCPADRLDEIFSALLALAHDDDRAPSLARKIEPELGRRARRKVRRALEDFGPESLEQLDADAWQEELRAIAGVCALQSGDADLRAALLDLCRSDEASRDGGEDPDPEADPSLTADLTPRIAGARSARGLLGKVVTAWTGQLGEML